MAQHNETGKQGEAEAVRFLEEKGYEIIARNYRHQHAEIDLIARKGKMLIFVEVKTRTNLSFGNPEEFVSYTKAKLVMKAAEQYVFATNWTHDLRFDIVAVTLSDNERRIKHVEDAFY
ncbi:YraN family protein [Spirosoma sp. KUDC1026]|uniref:YraN family protein n=1 Tax=Spirosoma sp. KUDC1026 TaxID=2745947 RepID=UPI00159BAB8C|nr:YraN family protein [Spirosoma sp. KUDC1026]QKZ11297.1 YraN family protein [Spirosoma sp. KUDC1026]